MCTYPEDPLVDKINEEDTYEDYDDSELEWNASINTSINYKIEIVVQFSTYEWTNSNVLLQW